MQTTILTSEKDGGILFWNKKSKAKKAKKPEVQYKMTKAEKKRAKQRRKIAEARKKKFIGQPGFTSDEGYVEFDGYIHEYNGRYVSVFDVLVQYGTHNPEVIGWLTKLIPTQQLKDGDIYFAYREKGMSKGTENEIFSKKLHSRKITMLNSEESTDERENSKKRLELEDIQLTNELAKNEHIVDSDISLVVWADTPEQLKKTVDELRQNYKDSGIPGFMIVRKIFKQKEELFSLFNKISANKWHNADMESVAASRLFLPSSGFVDPQGVYVGEDLESLLYNNSSIIDFNGIRHAVVITGGTSVRYSLNGLEYPIETNRSGSAWAHVIAEDNYLVNGKRTHHINLVPFDYHAPNSKVLDMQKYTLNTLEVYGTKENVEVDANDNFEKVTEIIMMLLGENAVSSDQYANIRGMLKEQLIDWVIKRAGGNGIYTLDPQNEPTRAWRILATEQHQNYPTIGDFVLELDSVVARERKVGENAGDRAQLLLRAVKTAVNQYPQVFNAKTNIPDKFTYYDRNIYYDLSKLSNNRVVKGAMFLNTLSYVANRAMPGDMIVIHGLDSITVSPRILKPYREKMDEKGIGLITTLEERDNKEMNIKTLNSFIYPLSTQDLVVLGGLTPDSLKDINYSWNKELSKRVRDELLANANSRFYVYRARDLLGTVIDTHLIL